MTSLRRTLGLALAAFTVLATNSAFAGEAARPIVVELFTSQGCSSCPPADALLGKLAQRPGVIAISLPITYWDMLGWKDTLASDANTRRQKAYAAAMNHGGVYTPQIVVDGVVDVVGSRAANVEAAIAARRAAIQAAAAITVARADMARAAADAARAETAVPVAAAMPALPAMPARDPIVQIAVTQSPQEMHIDIGAAPGAPNATVWMFHLRAAVGVNIAAGENEGHTIVYHNVAGDVRALGIYKGRAMSLTLPRAAMAGLPHDGVAGDRAAGRLRPHHRRRLCQPPELLRAAIARATPCAIRINLPAPWRCSSIRNGSTRG